MDGGSRDGTIDVLRGYGERCAGSRRPMRGQSAAINAGWRSRSGDVIAWLNADDAYLPGADRRGGRRLRGRSRPRRRLRRRAVLRRAGPRSCGPIRPRSSTTRASSRRAVCFLPQPATFLRRRVLESEGGLDESLHYALDLEYWLRLGAAGRRFRHLPVEMALLRLHAGGQVRPRAGRVRARDRPHLRGPGVAGPPRRCRRFCCGAA